jgi:AcrR family transcriptional regulator
MGDSKTKEKIIAVATDLFYKHGFVKASIRDIVRKVGVTNATFYIHFKNKAEILYYIIEGIGSTLHQGLQQVIDAHDDPKECLKEMIYSQVCLMKEKRKEIRIYVEEQYQLPTVLRNRALRQHRQIYDLFKNKISEISERGLIEGLDDTVVTFSIFAMMNWVYRWFYDDGKLSIEEVANQVIHIFFTGIFGNGAAHEKSSKVGEELKVHTGIHC